LRANGRQISYHEPIMVVLFESVWNILLALAPWLLLGAIFAGVLHVMLPEDFLKRQLTGPWGVFKAVGLGVPLPLCSCGVIPVGMGLKKGGGSDGAVVGFLISTPQTGVDSILVSASMLGWPFALFKLASAAVTGIVGGLLTETLADRSQARPQVAENRSARTVHPMARVFGHGVMLLHSIWGWLLFGILVSAAIDMLVPKDALEGLSSHGSLGVMLITLLIAIPLYVCATASVPIAAALVASGLPTGAVLVFLMAGPATNIATLGAIYRTLGRRPTVIYLATVVVGSIACGWLFDFVINTDEPASGHDHVMGTWWATASALVLLVLMGRFAVQDGMRLLQRRSTADSRDRGPTVEMGVQGMVCQGCVAKLEKCLSRDANVEAVQVTLQPGGVTVHGTISHQRVRKLIEQAGFHPHAPE
jgi:uncharacterized protein